MKTSPVPLASEVTFGGKRHALDILPAGCVADDLLGLVLGSPQLSGQVVHVARERFGAHSIYETRATVTPRGEYLLMFPEGTHYNSLMGKGNAMVAYRSSDQGITWRGPTEPFDIDYSQHGFIPLIPRGSNRLYAFGTQAIPFTYTREHGLFENAPIGYRYSDDDGYHWSEVRVIRPQNDPEFRGMSVMRMCETDAGTWLLGAHEGDHSYNPVMSRQYVLRSEDQGASWMVVPHERHGGWCVPRFNRMDEGRPINLGNGHVLMQIRTCEGHLWATWSEDDGRTWRDPRATSLIHPDAPPMLTFLSDGVTLAAFHHNRHHDTSAYQLDVDSPGKADRSEIWVAFSRDGGATWSEPHFVFANAVAPDPGMGNFVNCNCSYLDIFVDQGKVQIFFPHRWQRALHLTISEADLLRLPTAKDL